MARFPLRFSVFLSSCLVAMGWVLAEDFSYHVRQAIFSDHQFFWPGLASSQTAPARSPKADGIPSEARIGVLPIRIRDYRESISCDSCHRLSANGMEFYFENYLKDKLANRFPKAKVELIAPHFLLLATRKLDLLASLDSLDFPWARWFDDSTAPVIYRPHDRLTSAADRKRLDHLGGLLNQGYLLVPTRVDILVKPLLSGSHTGGFEWKFALVFWNVARGEAEWALLYDGKAHLMDLDKSLDEHLDKALGAAWDGLPGGLAALWSAEPR